MSKLIFEKKFDEYQFEVWDGPPAFNFCEVNQVHGADVCDFSSADKNQIADGIIANKKIFTPLAIRTADCVPIIVIGKKGVALLHAGWMGVKNNILLHPLVQNLNIEKGFLGPHISVKNYEVQKDFLTHFPDQDNYEIKGEKNFFNLQRALQKQSPKIKLESSGICTFENLQFHSFRRDKTTKRNYNILKPRGPL